METEQIRYGQGTELIVPTVNLAFWTGYDLVWCYEAVFRTVPLHDMNGCSFSHQDLHGAGGSFQIYIVSQDENTLRYVQSQLMSSQAFMQTQAGGIVSMAVMPKKGALDGRVSGNMLEPSFGNRNSPIVAGWQLAMGMTPTVKDNGWGAAQAPCAQCGAVSDDRIFCGQCGAKTGRLNNVTKGFLVVYLLLFLGQFAYTFFTVLPWLGHSGISVYLAINTVQTAICVFGAVLLLRGRKAGFYVMVAERVVNLIIYLITLQANGAQMLGSGIGIILFTAIAYGCLHKDLLRMK